MSQTPLLAPTRVRPTVVIGATRGTGRHVVEILLQREVPVRIVVRNVEKARALFGDRVEVFHVDLARIGTIARGADPNALRDALTDAAAVVYTAAVPPGVALEHALRAVDYGGVAATIHAAQQMGFTGRFVYMSTMGLHQRTVWMRLLDIIKWNVLYWRAAAERELTSSGLDAVIVRAGILTNGKGGDELDISPGDRPLTLVTRVARADVARVLVNAIDSPMMARDVSVFARR